MRQTFFMHLLYGRPAEDWGCARREVINNRLRIFSREG
jgi:hypothetical protein